MDGETCNECDGRGMVTVVEQKPGFISQHTAPCTKCRGQGMIATKRCESCKGTANNRVQDKKIISKKCKHGRKTDCSRTG